MTFKVEIVPESPRPDNKDIKLSDCENKGNISIRSNFTISVALGNPERREIFMEISRDTRRATITLTKDEAEQLVWAIVKQFDFMEGRATDDGTG